MSVTCEQLNPHACKTYLIGLEGSNEAVLIDPVIDYVGDYISLVSKRKLTVPMVIDTHCHADHISGAASLKEIFHCDYLMYRDSASQCVSVRVDDGYRLNLFDCIAVRVMHSPGHTRDSMSLIFPEWIFTGDALFLDEGGAGRDDLPGGDPRAHWETLQKFSALPGELIVYPAHDYHNRKPSSLKLQKQTNPHLKKSREGNEAFVRYLEDLKLGPADWMRDVLKANYACTKDPKAARIPADSPACEVKGTLSIGAHKMQVSRLSAPELKLKLLIPAKPVLLDVREKAELDGPLGHIEGIIHIPIAGLGKRLDELERYRDKEIVTICRSGGRAYTAAQILTTAGFKKVAVLEGGMTAWQDVSP